MTVMCPHHWNTHHRYEKKKEIQTTIEVEGNAPFTMPMKLNRNSPCPCGSGRKYKKCCFSKCDCNGDEDEGISKNKPQEMYCKSCYRFSVGDRVGAAMGESFRPGTIVALNYREPGWLGHVPYQIELDGSAGHLVFAPHDEDDWVRALTSDETSGRRRRRN